MFKRMKSSFLAVAMLAAGAVGPAALAAGSGHEARFGGIHMGTQVMDLEVVAKPDLLQIYASDHNKPLKIEGGKARITLLNGADKVDIDLAPVGDKFEAKGIFKVLPGTKGVVLVTLAGKPGTTARFTVK